jgi:hypothetical protein
VRVVVTAPPTRWHDRSVGAPLDITVGELALESFYPADGTTAETLRELAR